MTKSSRKSSSPRKALPYRLKSPVSDTPDENISTQRRVLIVDDGIDLLILQKLRSAGIDAIQVSEMDIQPYTNMDMLMRRLELPEQGPVGVLTAFRRLGKGQRKRSKTNRWR
jgi:hypothetical protein